MRRLLRPLLRFAPLQAWLKARADVDPKRIAVFGWSYGGYMTLKLLEAAPGVFAAGDCTTVPYKQIIIAMGEGAKASLAAFDYLIRNSAPE